ncbi:hypothetical protein HZH68_013986 [Vespula germanica]|uniref:Cytochrome P450 n=1 Tax=Vespula germanica TaxID=30212 RepID=A0A834JDB2_VESGE|nr:hypothetical protein HZH68_013986 [Vespula germanica]
MMFLTISLSLLFLLFILHCLIRYGRVRKILHHIPGPKAYPIIGNIYHLQVNNEHILEKLWKMNEKFYPIYNIWTFFFSIVIILQPEDVELPSYLEVCVFSVSRYGKFELLMVQNDNLKLFINKNSKNCTINNQSITRRLETSTDPMNIDNPNSKHNATKKRKFNTLNSYIADLNEPHDKWLSKIPVSNSFSKLQKAQVIVSLIDLWKEIAKDEYTLKQLNDNHVKVQLTPTESKDNEDDDGNDNNDDLEDNSSHDDEHRMVSMLFLR